MLGILHNVLYKPNSDLWLPRPLSKQSVTSAEQQFFAFVTLNLETPPIRHNGQLLMPQSHKQRDMFTVNFVDS